MSIIQKFKPISMMVQDKINHGAKMIICWKYYGNPADNKAKVKLYGIDSNGETLLGTAVLDYIDPVPSNGDIYQSAIYEFLINKEKDYPFVRLVYDVTDCAVKCDLYECGIIGFITEHGINNKKFIIEE